MDAEVLPCGVGDEGLDRTLAAGALDPHAPPEPPGYPGSERHERLRRRTSTSS